ncbi:MAG: magnesium transporter, partial [Ideonella sp.]|nr:magnesium transporter [Ideonella sp.]
MLINCVAYQDGRKVADVPVGRIADWLGRPDCFVWVALRDASEDELLQMQRAFGLHDLAVEDARHGHQRPKLEEYGDTVFVVLHLLSMEGGQVHTGEIAIFVGLNFVLSVRTGSREDFLGVRERCEREPQLLRHGAGFVFYALMDAVVDRYFPLLDAIETELEGIEARIFEPGAARSNIERLYGLKRRATLL